MGDKLFELQSNTDRLEPLPISGRNVKLIASFTQFQFKKSQAGRNLSLIADNNQMSTKNPNKTILLHWLKSPDRQQRAYPAILPGRTADPQNLHRSLLLKEDADDRLIDKLNRLRGI